MQLTINKKRIISVRHSLLLCACFCGFALLSLSCAHESKEQSIHASIQIDTAKKTSSLEDQDHTKKVKVIFYNVPSPLELANLLERSGAAYDSELLNSETNADKYATINSIALNLGVYGADLSYNRMFEQIQATIVYLALIKKLSEKLGIPQDEKFFALGRIEENIENRDSLLHIITDTYSTADSFLKENNRGHTAAIIILGGWIETLYISANMIDDKKPNKEIMQRIIEQRYTLTNLIALLKLYEDNESVAFYVEKLTELQQVFSKVKTEGKTIQTSVSNGKTIISSDTEEEVELEIIQEIRSVVSKLRQDIVKV